MSSTTKFVTILPMEDELIQWSADTSRLLKIGLRTYDPETVASVMARISARLGEDMAEAMLLETINQLMTTENWSFFDEETGEASPLV